MAMLIHIFIVINSDAFLVKFVVIFDIDNILTRKVTICIYTVHNIRLLINIFQAKEHSVLLLFFSYFSSVLRCCINNENNNNNNN